MDTEIGTQTSAPIFLLLLSGEKRRRRERIQTGALAPGTSALTKLSPERATEYITCLISNCFYLCRPFGTFHVVTQLPGANAPVCSLSSLRDYRVSPHEMLLSRKPNYRRISRVLLFYPDSNNFFLSQCEPHTPTKPQIDLPTTIGHVTTD